MRKQTKRKFISLIIMLSMLFTTVLPKQVLLANMLNEDTHYTKEALNKNNTAVSNSLKEEVTTSTSIGIDDTANRTIQVQITTDSAIKMYYEQLTVKIEAVKKLKKDEYTVASYTVLEEALQKAETLLALRSIKTEELSQALKDLEAAISALELKDLRTRLEESIPETLDFLLQNANSPDWVVAGLGRLPAYKNRIPSDYLEKKVAEVATLAQQQDVGNSRFKITELERISIGMVAAGGDPTNVGGIDMIERIFKPISPAKPNQDYIKRQGINAVIFGLIAVDTNNYIEPTDALWTREKFVNEILSKEITNLTYEKGGWALSGKNPDPDITGMSMIALAPYTDRKDVKEAIDRGVQTLARLQIETGENAGGYRSWGTTNSESCVQVIMGLCANGVDPSSEQFTKEGKNVVDALLRFKVEGGFAHTLGDGTAAGGAAAGKPNGMASEQALYGVTQVLYSLDGNRGSIFRWQDAIDSVNKSKLQAKLKEVKALNKLDYINENYKVLQIAIEEAETIYSKQDATQIEIDQQIDYLEKAIKQLITSNKIRLNNLLKQAKKFIEKEYTLESFKVLKEGIKAAEEILYEANTPKNVINEKIELLENVIKQLVRIPLDTSKLEAKLEQVRQIKPEGYTRSAYETVKEAIKVADNFLKNKDVTQAQVEWQVQRLENVLITPRPEVVKGYATVCIEKFTPGHGYMLEPVLVKLKEGETAYSIVETAYGKENFKTTGAGNSVYIAGMKDNTGKSVHNTPPYLQKEIDAQGLGSQFTTEQDDPEWIGEFDYFFTSGWMLTASEYFIPMSSGAWKIEEGDVVRWQFTTYGLGADLGSYFMSAEGGGVNPIVLVANRDSLLTEIAKVEFLKKQEQEHEKQLYTAQTWMEIEAAKQEALALTTDLTSSQQMINNAFYKLKTAIAKQIPDVDKQKLQVRLQEARKITPSAYTESSFKALQEAIKQAQAVFEKQHVTQEEVDSQIKYIAQAISQLVSITGSIDIAPPTIKTSLVDKLVINKPELSFTVEVTDDTDSAPLAIITLNGEVLKSKDTNYIARLLKGKNTIKIEATDKSNNKISKEFIVEYKPSDQTVTVKIRVEAYDETVIPMRDVTVDVFDLTPHTVAGTGSSANPSGDWNIDKFKTGPTAAHATVKVLEAAHRSYELQDYGWSLYFAMINEDREFDYRSTSGWMYRVNGVLPSFGSQEYVLKDGDVIEWYFGAYGFETAYTKLDVDKKELKMGEPVKLYLYGEITDLSATSGSGSTIRQDIDKAEIYVDGKPYMYKGKKVVTDQMGKTTLTFDKPGKYKVSAERLSGEGLKNCVRPIPIEITVDQGSAENIELENDKYKDILKEVIQGNFSQKEILDKIGNVIKNLDKTSPNIVSEIKDIQTIIDIMVDKLQTEEAIKNILQSEKYLIQQLGAVKEKASNEALQVIFDKVTLTSDKIITKSKDNAIIGMAAVQTIQMLGNLNKEIQQEVVKQQTLDIANKAIEKITTVHLQPKDTISYDKKIVATPSYESIKERTEALKETIETINEELYKNKLIGKKKIADTIVLRIENEEAKTVEIVLTEKINEVLKEKVKQINVEVGKVVLKVPSVVLGTTCTLFVQAKEEGTRVQLLNQEGTTVKLLRPIKVCIPYKIGKRQIRQTVVLHNDKNEEINLGGNYNVLEGTVSFLTNELGDFEVVSMEKDFVDLQSCTEEEKEAIYNMAAKGIINGKDNQIFEPEATITRAEMAVLFTNMLKENLNTDLKVFEDLAENAWYTEGIATMKALNYMNGNTEKTFAPNGVITNEEIATIMGRVLEEEGYYIGVVQQGTLENVSDYAKGYVALLIQEGIIENEETFMAKAYPTRKQVAQMLAKTYSTFIK